MISLNSRDHQCEVFINPAHIVFMRPVGKFTSIVLANGMDLQVTDDAADVMRKIAKHNLTQRTPALP